MGSYAIWCGQRPSRASIRLVLILADSDFIHAKVAGHHFFGLQQNSPSSTCGDTEPDRLRPITSVSASSLPLPYSPLLIFPMFRVARFNAIRRTLHTQAKPSPGSLQANRLAFAGAASAVALTYFAWRTSSPSKQLAMDTNMRIREDSPNNCRLI